MRAQRPGKLITDQYRDLNKQLHTRKPNYGTSGALYADIIEQLVDICGARTILDYGCGKGTLSEALPHLEITEYDPCIPGKDQHPQRHDLVICSDVLEHIEPELIDNVLDDLQALTGSMLFCLIATSKAHKSLADGRNAHLIVEPYQWWLPKLWSRFRIEDFQIMGSEAFIISLRSLDEASD